MKGNRSKNKGFTLVELLAIIAILSLVVTGVITIVNSVINNTREKSYKVTINNIEKEANSYILEELIPFGWISSTDGSYEYQCVTVQNLIDAGYFKGDVLNSNVTADRKVLASDSVYIEREPKTKNIVKHILIYDEKYSGLCPIENAVGKITFGVSPNGWSKSKTVTITYRLYNIESSKFKDYSYKYISSDININKNGSFNDYEIVETKEVNKNGVIYASIEDKDKKTITSNTLTVDKIDNEKPSGEIKSTNNVASKQTVTLSMNDSLSGISEYYFGVDNPNTNNVSWISAGSVKNKTVTTTVDYNDVSELKDVVYYLGVKDLVGNMTVVSKTFYKTTLSIENATVSVKNIITMSGYSFNVPTAVADKYYTFYGWYSNSSYTGNVITSYTPTGNSTLYGKTSENKLTGGVVEISGNLIYGDTLTATITSDTTPKADKYTYQWYISDTPSMSGGTPIYTTTTNKLDLKGAQFGKYVYVIVTATKTNYSPTTFGDNTTEKVAKRLVTVTANSNSKIYDGKELIDKGCTADNLVYGHVIKSCTMTSGSTITDADSVDNLISKVVIYSNTAGADVGMYYDIKKVSGTLTVSKKEVPVIWSSDVAFVYDGYEHGPTASVNTGVSSENMDVSWDTAVIAGNHTSEARCYIVTGGRGKCSNYKLIDNKKDFTITQQKYTITYNSNGGTGSMNSTSCVGNVACTVSNNGFSREGYNFIKWNTKADGTGINYNAGADYVLSGNVTLYAQWDAKIYTITYYANGGTDAPSPQTRKHGDVGIFIQFSLPREGYKFIEWNTSPTGAGKSYKENTIYNENKDLTLYAIWEKSYTVTISYNVNGGNVTSFTQNDSGTQFAWTTDSTVVSGVIFKNGKELTTKINYGENMSSDGLVNWDNSKYLNITKTGYIAVEGAEWKCYSGDCKKEYYSDSQIYSASDFCDASKGDCKVMLAVNWKSNTYTITFKPNGGYGSVASDGNEDYFCSFYKPTEDNHDVKGAMSTVKCEYGKTCTLPSNAYSRQCHKFLGWTTKTDTESVFYNNYTVSGKTCSQLKSSHEISASKCKDLEFNSSDTDEFYENGDKFTYNKTHDITLYAVWLDDHKWNAIGTQIQVAGSDIYTCGHYHETHGAYSRFCSVCQMSSKHYNACYKPLYQGSYSTKWCPCGISGAKYTYDDYHDLQEYYSSFYKTNSWYNKINYAYSPSNDYGGIVENRNELTEIKVNNKSGNYAPIICADHYPYTVTLNQDGSNKNGTAIVYGVKGGTTGSGIYLNLNSTTKEYTNKISNIPALPTKTGYTFGGYYTKIDGQGEQYISSTGRIIFNSNSHENDFTLYAYWIKNN